MVIKDKGETILLRYFPTKSKTHAFASNTLTEQIDMPLKERLDVFVLPHYSHGTGHFAYNRRMAMMKDEGKFLDLVAEERERERKGSYKKGWEMF